MVLMTNIRKHQTLITADIHLKKPECEKNSSREPEALNLSSSSLSFILIATCSVALCDYYNKIQDLFTCHSGFQEEELTACEAKLNTSSASIRADSMLITSVTQQRVNQRY